MVRHGIGRRMGSLSLLLAVTLYGCDSGSAVLALGSVPVSLSIAVPSGSSGPAGGAQTLPLVVGDTVTLSATAFDAIGQPVGSAAAQWASSDPSVATVTAQGLVLGVGAGAAEVSATVSGIAAALSVVVSDPN